MTAPLKLPAAPRILVICTRRLGDVLLNTALIRSLRQAWPDARIDLLVNAGTEAMVAGNPDLDTVIVWPKRDRARVWQLVRQLWRGYSLAIATLSSDRAHGLAWLAAPVRVAVTPEDGAPGGWWKRRLSPRHTPVSLDRSHVVVQSLRLATLIGIAPQPQLQPPIDSSDERLASVLGNDWRSQRWAVVHPSAMYRYKNWTPAGWQAVVAWLISQGCRVVITGGPADDEKALAAQVIAGLDPGLPAVVNAAGRLPLAALTGLLREAALFIGPDTSVTHLAAACDTPTLALFGPSSPVAWGPWPQGWEGVADSPWRLQVPFQRVGKVGILQGDQGRQIGCIPCLQEGCERHTGSASDCLDRLSAQRVISAAAQLLGVAAPA